MSIQNVNVARFAGNVEWDFFCDFQTPCIHGNAVGLCRSNSNAAASLYPQLPTKKRFATDPKCSGLEKKLSLLCYKHTSQYWLTTGFLLNYSLQYFFHDFSSFKTKMNTSFCLLIVLTCVLSVAAQDDYSYENGGKFS